MATGGSPNISQPMVPSSTSTLRRSNRSKSNISLIQKSKNYELNKQKAIDKKRNDCNSPHIRYEMKPRNNFCISFSTAAYELVKEFLHKYFDKQQCQEEYAIAVENGLDKSNAIVETRFRIYNKKRDGSIGNQHKYTVNCYNTTSRVLVNGVKTDKFVDNVLPIILELITSKESELDSVNNDIQRTLQPIEVNHWSNISLNKDIPYVTEQSSIEYTQISQTEDQQNVTIYFCPMCNERAGERTVGCEQCDEWIHFNCAGLKDSDIEKIKDNPFVCRLCIENNLYSTEIVHNNTSVNNAVIDILHLDQQEPATELSKDKDQSTQPTEDEMKIIQQNIQIVETNSSIVITEETQSKDQNMLTTSNSVQTLPQNKTAIESEQRPTVKEKKTSNQNSLNQSKGQQRKSKDVEEFKKYIYELENRLKDRDQTINLLERKMALLEGNILIANQQMRNSEQAYHMFNQQPNNQANHSGCQSQCQYQHLSNNMRALEQQMSQHMCITTALTTQLAIQLQQSLSSTRNQIPPVNINMVPQPAPYIQGQPHLYHQYPMYNHASQPTMQAGLFNQYHVPQATNFAFHPSQGITNLNAAHHNQYIHQSTHGHPSRNHVRPTQASYQNQNRQANGQIPPPPTYHQANLQRSSHYHQNRNNNQTMMTQHTNANAKASSNTLEKQQANTTHVLYADNSTKVVAQVPTIICSDGQNKMVHRNNVKTHHIPVSQPTTESKHSEVTITENFQVSASLVQSEVAPLPGETIKESNQIVHQEENSIKQMTGNNQDAIDEGRQNQSNSFLEIPSLKNKPPDILRMGMATETLNSHGRD